MKYRVLIIMLLFGFFLNGQRKSFQDWESLILSNKSFEKIKQSVKNENFTSYYNKKDIPKPLMDFLKNWNKKIDFANPDQLYNSTDCADETLPNRQIILILKNKNHVLITYSHGGIGFHHHILWAEIKNNTVKDIWIGVTFESLKSKKEILKVLSQKPEKLNTNMICY